MCHQFLNISSNLNVLKFICYKLLREKNANQIIMRNNCIIHVFEKLLLCIGVLTGNMLFYLAVGSGANETDI